MKHTVGMRKVTVFITGFFLCISCTENPFFGDDEIETPNSTVRGKIVLSDGSQPKNATVWFEGLDLSTTTGSDGSFQLVLPAPKTQPGQGLDGVFRMYYYVSNYRITASNVALLKGYVEDNQGDIGENGNLMNTVSLEKLLHIKTAVEPETIWRSYSGGIHCTVFLEAVTDSVMLIASVHDETLCSGYFWPDGKDAQDVIMAETEECLQNMEIVRASQPEEWHFILNYEPDMYPAGDYEFIPYIVILQAYIPPGLYSLYGTNPLDFGRNYLNMPCKRTGGRLRILDPP